MGDYVTDCVTDVYPLLVIYRVLTYLLKRSLVFRENNFSFL